MTANGVVTASAKARPDPCPHRLGGLVLPVTARSAHQAILSSRPPGHPGASAGAVLAGPHPDVPFVHEFDLPVYHLAPVVIVPVRGPVQVEVLRVDRLFV